MSNLNQEFIELGAYLSQKGYAIGSAGNLSVRRDDNHIICTPSNSNLGNLTEEELSVVAPNGELVQGNRPTKEINFHKVIYEKYDEAKVIIHLHSTYLTALSCLNNLNKENVIKAFTPYVVMRLGSVPIIPYFKPGSAEIGEAIKELPSHISGFLMANHGVTVFAQNIKDATQKFEELEETARLYFLLRGEGIRYLSDAEVQELTGA